MGCNDHAGSDLRREMLAIIRCLEEYPAARFPLGDVFFMVEVKEGRQDNPAGLRRMQAIEAKAVKDGNDLVEMLKELQRK